jgi:hypothetical protein
MSGRRVIVTVGYSDDWRVGEVFLSVDKKVGSDGDIATRDTAILISLALQHGCTLATLAQAVTRAADGRPEGLAGIVLEALINRGAA